MRAAALTFAGIFGAVAIGSLLAAISVESELSTLHDSYRRGKADEAEAVLGHAILSAREMKWYAAFWAATITSAVFFTGACAAGSPSRRPGSYRTTPGMLADPRGQLPPTPRREDPAEFLDSLR